ncbi:MAG: outer membrane lipid asymmetry maintenance protein MlaD [Thiopseudomonas sp.]|nr:outer membrane lipid asymmetry maintenance protein MlaD [Thiopseudomonas sp.]MCK9465921.1 outer membrane lipid asymmetry maintenance protein MlaD [Thiopseudomonas sp.]
MRIRALEMSVGVFLLIGIAALVVLALRVSGLTVSTQDNTYTLYAAFDNVAGLTTRGRVTMAGVTVGKVMQIEFDKETFTGRVTLAVNKDVDNLPTDTTASILTAGLLGEKYVSLSVGGEDEVLKDQGVIYDTQSSLVLEELIGKFLMNSVSSEQ